MRLPNNKPGKAYGELLKFYHFLARIRRHECAQKDDRVMRLQCAFRWDIGRAGIPA